MTALKAFGGIEPSADEYDEIIVTPTHRARMLAQTAITNPGPPPLDGVKLTTDARTPEGLGVLRRRGKVVGILDFVHQQVIFFGKATK